MFDEWRKRRELKKQLASLKKKEAAVRRALDDFDSPEYHSPRELPELGYDIRFCEQELDKLETTRLVRNALRLGIQIPEEESWWEEDESEAGDGSYKPYDYLTQVGKENVSRLIRDERRKNVEWWVKVITPILSALIALLGLIVALVSVSRK